jgi:hypothetical protein
MPQRNTTVLGTPMAWSMGLLATPSRHVEGMVAEGALGWQEFAGAGVAVGAAAGAAGRAASAGDCRGTAQSSGPISKRATSRMQRRECRRKER